MTTTPGSSQAFASSSPTPPLRRDSSSATISSSSSPPSSAASFSSAASRLNLAQINTDVRRPSASATAGGNSMVQGRSSQQQPTILEASRPVESASFQPASPSAAHIPSPHSTSPYSDRSSPQILSAFAPAPRFQHEQVSTTRRGWSAGSGPSSAAHASSSSAKERGIAPRAMHTASERTATGDSAHSFWTEMTSAVPSAGPLTGVSNAGTWEQPRGSKVLQDAFFVASTTGTMSGAMEKISIKDDGLPSSSTSEAKSASPSTAGRHHQPEVIGARNVSLATDKALPSLPHASTPPMAESVALVNSVSDKKGEETASAEGAWQQTSSSASFTSAAGSSLVVVPRKAAESSTAAGAGPLTRVLVPIEPRQLFARMRTCYPNAVRRSGRGKTIRRIDDVQVDKDGGGERETSATQAETAAREREEGSSRQRSLPPATATGRGSEAQRPPAPFASSGPNHQLQSQQRKGNGR